MSLPACTGDKAALCALDRQCADPNSIVSKRIVAQFAAKPPEYKETFLMNFTVNFWTPGPTQTRKTGLEILH